MFATTIEYNLKLDEINLNRPLDFDSESHKLFIKVYNSAILNQQTDQLTHLFAFRLACLVKDYKFAKEIIEKASSLNQRSPSLQHEVDTILFKLYPPPIIGDSSKQQETESTTKRKTIIHDPYNLKAQKGLRELREKKLTLIQFENFRRKLLEINNEECKSRFKTEFEFNNSSVELNRLQQINFQQIQKEIIRKNKIQEQKNKELQKKLNIIFQEEQKNRSSIYSTQSNKQQEILVNHKKSKSEAQKKENVRMRIFHGKISAFMEREKKERDNAFEHHQEYVHLYYKAFDFIKITSILENFKAYQKINYQKPEIFTNVNLIILSLQSLLDNFSRFGNINTLDFKDIEILQEANWYIKTSNDEILQIANDENIKILKEIDYRKITLFINEILNKKFAHDNLNIDLRKEILSHLSVFTWLRHASTFLEEISRDNINGNIILDSINKVEGVIKKVYENRTSKDRLDCKTKIIELISDRLPCLALLGHKFKEIEKVNCDKIWIQYLTLGVEFGFKYHNTPKLFLKYLIFNACKQGTTIALAVYLNKAREIGLNLNENFENCKFNALALANQNGHTDTAQLLIEYGVDTKVKNKI